MTLTEQQYERYSRQIMLSGIGTRGQERLLSSRVLVIGAGGLGSPVLMYLAASGVGHIGIADDDKADLSNLQRQIIHTTESVGMSKALSAENALKRLNPEVVISAYETRVNADNIESMISEYDFIIDCADNFSTKLLINDACVLMKKPFCYGGVQGFGGQLMTYVPGGGACLRCLFEDAPTDENKTDSELAILGSVPGVIGSLQALEAQRYITGVGDLIVGSMLVFDGLKMTFRKIPVPKSQHCRVCGDNAKYHFRRLDI